MAAEAEEDWRICNAQHLKGLRLQFRRYWRWSEEWDHDHCNGCWAKFADFDGPDILHEGYATCTDYKHGAGYHWICKDCFHDLKDVMQWTDASDGPAQPQATDSNL